MSALPQRKVLVLNDEASIADLLALIKELGREYAADAYGERVLTTLSPRQIKSAIVDLRCSERRVRVHGVRNIWPSLTGRVLTVAVEVNSAETLELVAECLLRQNTPGGFFRRMSRRLLTLFGLAPSLHEVLIPHAQRK